MGQKVHPYGFRLGFNKTWRSRWFAKQNYAKLLQEDLELKKTLTDRLKSAGVSRRLSGVRTSGNAKKSAVTLPLRSTSCVVFPSQLFRWPSLFWDKTVVLRQSSKKGNAMRRSRVILDSP